MKLKQNLNEVDDEIYKYLQAAKMLNYFMNMLENLTLGSVYDYDIYVRFKDKYFFKFVSSEK